MKAHHYVFNNKSIYCWNRHCIPDKRAVRNIVTFNRQWHRPICQSVQINIVINLFHVILKKDPPTWYNLVYSRFSRLEQSTCRTRPNTDYILHILDKQRAIPGPGTRAECIGRVSGCHSQHIGRWGAFLQKTSNMLKMIKRKEKNLKQSQKITFEIKLFSKSPQRYNRKALIKRSEMTVRLFEIKLSQMVSEDIAIAFWIQI